VTAPRTAHVATDRSTRPAAVGVPASLRRAQILEQIRRTGGATVAELARSYSVSNMTAHRDLEQLAQEGLVERVRGGARALAGDTGHPGHPGHPTAWMHRIAQAAEEKQAIAARAASMVGEGSTIFLDASSTALALAERLMEDPPYELTLVTSSPMIGARIVADPVHVVICPGELDQHTRAIVGRWTVEFLGRLHFDIAFVSAAGITLDAGLTTSRSPLADVVGAARASASRTVGLVDSTKFGRASLVTIAAAADLDLIITDDGLDDSVVAMFRGGGVRLEVAARPRASGADQPAD
jgi:DeoR/GlpR family transcriptional regulator of sugar metabolism